MLKRSLEFIGMLLIGDGLLSLISPRRHCLLWDIGPGPCRELVEEFADHPNLARTAGVLETLLGLLLASEQQPAFAKRLFHR
jgi:hypothetical protein